MVTELERAKSIVELLSDIVSNRLTAEEALKRWPNVEEDLLSVAWHHLYHFSADEDIRARDQEYATYQINLLKECILEIKKEYQIS